MHDECVPENGWAVVRKLRHIFGRCDAVLAGGTALALQKGHRISRDLDFFTLDSFRTDTVIAALRNRTDHVSILSEGEGTLVVIADGIKLSLLKYEYPFLESPIRAEGLRIARVPDIADMKVIAISQRGTKRDFVDLYVIVQDMPFHRIAGHMTERFGRERINPVHIGKSLTYFADADPEPDPAYPKGMELEWSMIKTFFKNHARQYVLDLDAAVREGE